jgi:hypothetical protein
VHLAFGCETLVGACNEDYSYGIKCLIQHYSQRKCEHEFRHYKKCHGELHTMTETQKLAHKGVYFD